MLEIAKRRTVVFDLDETLVIALDPKINCLQESTWMQTFDQAGLIINAYWPHLILPGCIQLLRWLDQQNINLAFFSAGTSERNELLIPQLLCLALGQDRYEVIKDQVYIWSRESLAVNSIKELNADLLDLENTIFVEDNLDYVAKNQSQYVLNVMPTTIKDFVEANSLNRMDSRSLFHIDEKTFQAVNHVFYAAGVISRVIATSIKNNSNWNVELVKILQTDKQPNNRTLFKNYFRYNLTLMCQMAYYDIGLDALRKTNSQLNFYANKDSNLNDYAKPKSPQHSVGMYAHDKRREFREEVELLHQKFYFEL